MSAPQSNFSLKSDAKLNNVSVSSQQLPIMPSANLQLVAGNICIDSVTHNLVITDGNTKYVFAHL